MVHLENLLCFHYRPLFDNKSGSFSQTWPSPHTMLLQGGHFERTDPTLYGGRREGTVKLSKKAKCTITFDQDCTIFFKDGDRNVRHTHCEYYFHCRFNGGGVGGWGYIKNMDTIVEKSLPHTKLLEYFSNAFDAKKVPSWPDHFLAKR